MTDNIFDQYNQDEQNESIQFGDYVNLDFPFIQLYWWSFGDPRLLKLDKEGNLVDPLDAQNIQIFGGWYSGADKFLPAVAQMNGAPDDFSVTQLYPKNGQPFEAYQARLLYVAYITHREGWFPQKNSAKKYSKIDVLCLLGEYQKKEKIFKPYGPVVLSGSSYGAADIKSAFTKWKSISASARAEFANNLSESNFFVPIGSFGDDKVFTKERKSSTEEKSSFVTPPRLKEPKQFDYNILKMLFIGHDRATLELVKEYKHLAQPWVADMKTQIARVEQSIRENARMQAARFDSNPNYQNDPNYPPEEDKDIPF